MKPYKQIKKLFFFFSAKTSAFFAVVFVVVLLSSCAQVVAPGGGKKDITPPKVVKYSPDSAVTNFNSKSIEITFNEFIQLKDLNSQLIISPPLDNIPDISIKNKTLSIDFDKKEILKPNTTYSINFGSAIEDITENNPTEGFKYIFSTGSFIDSLSLKGKVENGFNHTTEKGILVMLYRDLSDSAVYKNLPDYFGKTKEDGTFRINNISTGKYKIVVLKDGNANYKYDAETESIGFVDAPIDVSEKQKLLIDVFQEQPRKLFLKKSIYDSYGKVVFVFNKSADSIVINPLNFSFKEGDVLLENSKNKDSLTYWFRNIDKDVLKLQVKSGNKTLDTVEYKLITKEEALKSRKNKLGLFLMNNFNGNQGFDLNSSLALVFNHPIESVNANVSLREDSVLIKDNDKFIYYSPDTNFKEKILIGKFDTATLANDPKGNLTIYGKKLKPIAGIFKENTTYHLYIPPGTFTDFFGLKNDTIKIDFKTKEEKYYGTIKLKVNVPKYEGQYIVQLLDDKEKVIRESIINSEETINYQYLYPSTYKLKLIEDENRNSKWDGGNYLKKIQPEKVIYYEGTINIRSNWDSDLEWKVKDVK